jgi:hypothetical protein
MKKKTFTLFFLALLIGSLIWLSPTENLQPASAQTGIIYYYPIFLKTWSKLTSTSYYMITIGPEFNYDLGCELGTRDALKPDAQDSVVVLDFSYPVCNADDSFGAELFGFGPVSLSAIATASKNFALGYYQCSAFDTESNLVIGIGTNNKPTSCDSSQELTDHGTAWANMVNQVNQWLKDNDLFGQVQAYGASDIEIGWNTPFLSRDWITGYEKVNAYPLIHFGDAAGCPYDDNPDWTCGGEWTPEDVWYVSWGASASIPLPLIYLTNGVHAQQWAYLSRYGVAEHGSRMDFTGVFTQSQACAQWTCNGTDNTPEEAYLQLFYELNEYPTTAQDLNWSTDIRWILREEAYPEIYGSAGGAASPTELTSIQQTIEAIRSDLGNPALDETTGQRLTDKLALLENIADAIDQAKANPAVKETPIFVGSSASSQPQFQTGLLPNGDIAGLPYGAVLSNLWQAQIDEGYLQIGAGSAPDNPAQGAIYILLTDRDMTGSIAKMVLAEETSGALAIIELTDSSLILQSESGTAYRFDLGTWELLTGLD